MVLAILIRGKSKFLDTAFRPSQVLLSISQAAVLSLKFRFQFPDSGFQLVHGFLASLQSSGLTLIKSGMHILNLGFTKATILLTVLGIFLLSSQFIQVSMQSLHLRFQFPLGCSAH